MRRRWSFPLFMVFGIGFAVAALGATWVATQALSSRLNQFRLKSAISKAVARANTPSDEECRAFAEKVQQEFASGKGSKIDSLFDWDAVIEEAFTGIEAPPQMRADVANGLKKKIHSKNGLLELFAKMAAKGDPLKLLKVREAHGRKVILFRVILEGGRVNYFEFVPARRPSGKVLAVDLFNYVNSELLSQSILRMMLPLLVEKSPSIVDKLFGDGNRHYVTDLPTLSKLMLAAGDGRDEEALRLYGKLHAETRRTKDAQFSRCVAANVLDQGEFVAAVDEFKALFPDDPSVEFLNIHYYTTKANYPKVLAAIDHLDKILGGDPYLNVLRGSISIMAGNYDDARRFALKAVEQEPSLDVAGEPLIRAAAGLKDYPELVKLLKKYDRQFDGDLGELIGDDLYEAFRMSPEYQRWLAYLKERDAK